MGQYWSWKEPMKKEIVERNTRTYQPKALTSTQPKQSKKNMDNRVVYGFGCFYIILLKPCSVP
jgi:hypothetical protein